MNIQRIHVRIGFQNLVNKFGGDSKAGTLVVSALKEDLGVIKKCSTDLKPICGYNTWELLNESLNKLVPTMMIKKRHNTLMMEFILETENRIKNNMATEMNVLLLHSKGYLVPCSLFCNILPTILEGLQLIIFLLEDQYLNAFRLGEEGIKVTNAPFFLLDSKYNIQGFNHAIYKLFNIGPESLNPLRYIRGNKFVNIAQIYPQIFSKANYLNMSETYGLDTDFDTKPLNETLLNEIFEYSNEGSNGPPVTDLVQSQSFSKYEFERNYHIVEDLTTNYALFKKVNIKLKIYRISSENFKDLKFYICSLNLRENYSEASSFSESLVFGHKDNETEINNMIMMDEDLQSISSSCIYI